MAPLTEVRGPTAPPDSHQIATYFVRRSSRDACFFTTGMFNLLSKIRSTHHLSEVSWIEALSGVLELVRFCTTLLQCFLRLSQNLKTLLRCQAESFSFLLASIPPEAALRESQRMTDITSWPHLGLRDKSRVLQWLFFRADLLGAHSMRLELNPTSMGDHHRLANP